MYTFCALFLLLLTYSPLRPSCLLSSTFAIGDMSPLSRVVLHAHADSGSRAKKRLRNRFASALRRSRRTELTAFRMRTRRTATKAIAKNTGAISFILLLTLCKICRRARHLLGLPPLFLILSERTSPLVECGGELMALPSPPLYPPSSLSFSFCFISGSASGRSGDGDGVSVNLFGLVEEDEDAVSPLERSRKSLCKSLINLFRLASDRYLLLRRNFIAGLNSPNSVRQWKTSSSVNSSYCQRSRVSFMFMR
mmetsp:Transcript_11003/g.15316  ORF Transcript_11003/g.15316 Transcript_11003/m.15316 type:complete len:252 (-) Transcript_11003:404-1159(-)